LFFYHPQYLGFSWFFEGKIRYFVFAVLPSGISTAGYIFSKVLREFVKDFRSKGKRITMVLDDGLAGDNDYDTAVKSSREEMTNCKIFVF
jgi:siroheme synthase (precorrin-2 oxidase/ferrochelatase)